MAPRASGKGGTNVALVNFCKLLALFLEGGQPAAARPARIAAVRSRLTAEALEKVHPAGLRAMRDETQHGKLSQNVEWLATGALAAICRCGHRQLLPAYSGLWDATWSAIKSSSVVYQTYTYVYDTCIKSCIADGMANSIGLLSSTLY